MHRTLPHSFSHSPQRYAWQSHSARPIHSCSIKFTHLSWNKTFHHFNAIGGDAQLLHTPKNTSIFSYFKRQLRHLCAFSHQMRERQQQQKEERASKMASLSLSASISSPECHNHKPCHLTNRASFISSSTARYRHTNHSPRRKNEKLCC